MSETLFPPTALAKQMIDKLETLGEFVTLADQTITEFTHHEIRHLARIHDLELTLREAIIFYRSLRQDYRRMIGDPRGQPKWKVAVFKEWQDSQVLCP